MTDHLNQQLKSLEDATRQGLFQSIRRGLEKETLRTTPLGEISQRPHPKALGSTLTHPHITTDYSEALLEFITPVCNSREATLDFLLDLHRFTLMRLEEQELLWPASMPCHLQGNASVPIAHYGSSPVGRMKEVYRHGLDWRYGRIMQTIAGLHYNVSFPDELWPLLAEQQGLGAEAADDAWRSEQYFGLIRNFRRHSWLLIYLFGASPVLDDSFVAARQPGSLVPLADQTLGYPYATSLRMSDLGYQNKVQSSLKICFNSLENYVATLQQAIRTPHPDYEKIGVRVGDEYRQLNTHLLQIENEYYSDIRPKRVTRSGQKPTEALQEKGVEYIEVRCLDINPFLPGGIDLVQMYFLDAFLLFCLLEPSPPLSEAECAQIEANLARVVHHGRDPACQLTQAGAEVSLSAAAAALLDRLTPVCELLDLATPLATPFSAALDQQRAKVDNPELTPSARLLALTQECGGHLAAGLELARAQREMLLTLSVDSGREQLFEGLTCSSLDEQQRLETEGDQDFAAYLQAYFAPASV